MKHKQLETKISSPEVRVVDASAGSGKTYALAHRYIQLMMRKDSSPDTIKTILAITFTNMAAREMKERILEFFKKIALNLFATPEERELIFSGVELDPQSARIRAQEVMDYIIRNYNFFQVQTIDSFIYLLLSGCAFRLGLPANFQLQENFRQLLVYSLDECIDMADRDENIKRIFQDFLRQYIYIENKENWFPKRDIIRLLNALFYQLNIQGKKFVKSDRDVADILEIKKEIKKMVTKLGEKYSHLLKGTFWNSLRKFGESEDIFDFGVLSRNKVFQYDYPPVKKDFTPPPELGREWLNIKEKIVDLARTEARAVFNCYVDIFELVYRIFESRAQKEELMFLQELNRKAGYLFGSDFLVPEIYYRLATRFRHFLIDEFQDTSRLQWENLFLMIEDALSTGGTLFYVGDKKQAIYRWRGGDVQLFDTIRNELEIYNIKQEQLNTNYRSQKEIVEFNNAVFSYSNLERFLIQKFGAEESFEYFSPSQREEILKVFATSYQKWKPENKYGYVRVEKIEGEDFEERNEKIKNRLGEIIREVKSRNFDFGDIAILCRTNDQVEMLSGWLMEEGFRVQSDKTLDIRNNFLIKELISFLKFLNSPIDNLSFTAFITGEIFGKATGISWRKLEEFLVQCTTRIGEQTREYIYRSFRATYPDIWNQYLDEFFKSVGFLSSYELTLRIITRFKIFQNFSEYQGFVMHLLELMKEKEEDYPSLEEFLDFYENTEEEVFYLRFSEADAIKVMTVHKAKGLEFPVVIVPFLDMDIKPGRSSERRDFSFVVFPENDILHLLRLDKKYAVFSPEIRNIYTQEYKRSFVDELNIVYVAFTRAQYELYAFLPWGRNKKNILLELIPPDYWERGDKRVYIRKKKDTEDVIFITPCEYKVWWEFLREEEVSPQRLRAREEIQRGNVLHSILSFIPDLSIEDKQEVLNRAFTAVGLRYKNISWEEYRNQIEDILEENIFRKFFYLYGRQVYTEKEIVDSRGMTRKIDRLIVDKDEVWVVEYKSGEPFQEYRQQVREYLQILRGIYPDRRLQGYILYVDKKYLEEINE